MIRETDSSSILRSNRYFEPAGLEQELLAHVQCGSPARTPDSAGRAPHQTEQLYRPRLIPGTYLTLEIGFDLAFR